MRLQGDKVKAGREALPIPITRKELADIVGVKTATIGNIENEKPTRRPTAEKIAKAIKIPLVNLIKREVTA